MLSKRISNENEKLKFKIEPSSNLNKISSLKKIKKYLHLSYVYFNSQSVITKY